MTKKRITIPKGFKDYEGNECETTRTYEIDFPDKEPQELTNLTIVSPDSKPKELTHVEATNLWVEI